MIPNQQRCNILVVIFASLSSAHTKVKPTVSLNMQNRYNCVWYMRYKQLKKIAYLHCQPENIAII